MSFRDDQEAESRILKEEIYLALGRALRRSLRTGDVSLFGRATDTVSRNMREVVNLRRFDKFRYAPLPLGQHIRLVSIRPGKRGSAIRCSIRNVNLEDSPKFAALSYTWKKDTLVADVVESLRNSAIGNTNVENGGEGQSLGANIAKSLDTWTETDKTILCNNTTLNITPSLYECLRQLRQTRPGDYWIDAMCINQDDDAEKSHQVSLMGIIYSKAESVIVWLGTCPSLLSAGIEVLLSSGPEMFQSQALDPSENQEKLDERLLFAVSTTLMMSSRWFTRLWVVQEVGLARRVYFLYGEHEIPSQLIVRAVHWIYGSEINEQDLLLVDAFGISSRASASDMRRALSSRIQEHAAKYGSQIKNLPILLTLEMKGDWSIDQWLQLCKGRRAKHAKDFVFAGLALIRPDTLVIRGEIMLRPPLPPRPGSQTTTSLPSNGPPLTSSGLWARLEPHYDASMEESLLNLAACILSRDHGTHLLSATSFFRRAGSRDNSHPNVDPAQEKLPSWLIDPTEWTTDDVQVIKSLVEPGYAACVGMPCNPQISSDGRALVVEAATLGEIGPMYDSRYPLVLGSNDLPLTRRSYHEFLLEGPKKYKFAPLSRLQALVSVLMSCNHSVQQPSLNEAVSSYCSTLHLALFSIKAWTQKDNNARDTLWQGLSERGAVEFADERKWQRKSIWKLKAAMRIWDKLIETYSTMEKAKADIAWIEKEYAALKKLYPEYPWMQLAAFPVQSDDLYSGVVFWIAVNDAMKGSRVFTTKNGYIGRGPECLRPGDVIALVKGGSVPYIFRDVDAVRKQHKRDLQLRLRKEKLANDEKVKLEGMVNEIEDRVGKGVKGWVLVGEAYVEGVMQGEATESLARKFEAMTIL